MLQCTSNMYFVPGDFSRRFGGAAAHVLGSALDSAAVLAASSSYFFTCGILYLFRASPILTRSGHEDQPMNFMQMECHCPKGCSDFLV